MPLFIMNAAPNAAQRPHVRNRSGWFVTWAVLSLGCGILLLVVCVRQAPGIEQYSGFHTARFGLVVLAILLGLIGTILAGFTLLLWRHHWPWSVPLMAFNVIAAIGVVIYVRWPRTPELLQAVRQGDIARVRWYARLGVNLDARGRWGWTWDCEGETALTAAAFQGDLLMVDALLELGAKIHAKDGWHDSPLHQAVISNRENIANRLLARGADINQPGNAGHTPLTTAVKFGRVEMVSLLLSQGADPNKRLPIAEAIEIDSQRLTAWRADVSRVGTMIQQLAQHGADLNSELSDGRTPLTAAVIAGRYSYIRPLIENGAQVDLPDRHGDTPLVRAAWQGNVDSVRAHIDAGADVNKSAGGRRTPLWMAQSNGHTAAAEALIAAGAMP